MPYSVLQSAFDGLLPKGLQWYWKADFFDQITDEAIAVHRRFGETIPTPLSTMHMYPISGAAARVPEDATAFAYRNGGWAGVIAGIDPDPANLSAAAGLGAAVLGGAACQLGRRRVREHDDGGRRSGAGPRRLPRQLRPAGPGQATLRPDQPVPSQPQHSAFLRRPSNANLPPSARGWRT